MASCAHCSGTSIYDVSTPLDPPGKSWQKVTDPAYNSDGQYSPWVLFSSISTFPKILITSVIILFAFLIGINEGLCLGSVIDAGVSTIFVGLGEDPMYVFHCIFSLCTIRLPVQITLPSLRYPFRFRRPLPTETLCRSAWKSLIIRVLADRSPALFGMIQQAYPRVVQGVPPRR